MAFNCSILLQDLDINCNQSTAGGINKVYIGLQKDLEITLDPVDETKVTLANLKEFVVIGHNKRDSYTVFNESKSTSNGLGAITTDINIRLPRLDNKLNKLDYMSRRSDIVCIMYHNNGTATISGWMDGLTINFNATSGTSIDEISRIDVTLEAVSWISSLSVEDISVIKLGNIWSNNSINWSNNSINWH
jgi:glutaredoxin-related protein